MLKLARGKHGTRQTHLNQSSGWIYPREGLSQGLQLSEEIDDNIKLAGAQPAHFEHRHGDVQQYSPPKRRRSNIVRGSFVIYFGLTIEWQCTWCFKLSDQLSPLLIQSLGQSGTLREIIQSLGSQACCMPF